MKYLLSLLVLLSAGVAFADPVTLPAKDEPTVSGAADSKPWSLSLEGDYVSKYYFRGYVQSPGGSAFLTNAELDYKVYDNNGITLTPYAGGFGDWTVNDGPHVPQNWSEADLFGGVRAGWNNFQLDANYTLYSYPNDSQHQTQEIGLTLSYDDSDFWSKCPAFAAVNPHVGYVHEIQDSPKRLNYFEIGVEPTLKPVNIVKVPVTFSLPVTFGLTDNGYFTDAQGHSNTLGFYSFGPKASLPLSFIPANIGSWTATAEIDYIHLNADSAKAADGRSDDFYVKVGVKVDL